MNNYSIVSGKTRKNKQMLNNIFIRFCQYLEERFPLKDFIPLSVVFAVTVGMCVQVGICGYVKSPWSISAGFFAFLLFLLRLRLFDEFKDFEHDSLYYSTRPVPRGLITLQELKLFILLTLCVEILLATSKGASSLILFFLAFIYSLLMFKEFFVKKWLRQHFTAYIIVHEILVFPLFFYIFSLNGMPVAHIGQIYFWVLALFFGCQLFLLEVVRKIRPTELEIPSRDTYTAQYGIKRASVLVICLGIIVILLKVFVEKDIYGKISLLNYLPLLVLIIFVFTIFHFSRHPDTIYAKKILHVSILFNLVIDLVLVTPLFFK